MNSNKLKLLAFDAINRAQDHKTLDGICTMTCENRYQFDDIDFVDIALAISEKLAELNKAEADNFDPIH